MLYLLSAQYFVSLVKVSLITEMRLQNAIFSHSSGVFWWLVVVCSGGKNTFLQVALQSEGLVGHRELGSYILIEIVCLQQSQSLLFYMFSPTERNNPHSSFY